ncbi:MAG: ABC transporter substrate-binding protein [Eubacteriales bacterium]|nr:ABC transporter substrate-binding protein [Eubacteriales bacterium]
MKKAIASVLAASMALSLAACGGSGSSSAAASTAESTASTAEAVDLNQEAVEGISDDAVLRVAIDGEPDSLFAAYQQNKADNRVNSSMFNYLVEWDDEAKEAKPSVATEWEWIDDTHIRFTLRDDVKFTNGETLVAEDVAESLAYSCQYHATYTQMFDPDNFQVEDDTHVVLALSKPYGNLLDILGCDYYTIFDWSAWQADNESMGADDALAKWIRDPVGSGPYKLVEWVDGDHLTLERNEDYWDKDNMPYYKQIVYSFISDMPARASALEAGTVDVAYNLASSQIDELKNASIGLTVNPYNQNVVMPLTFNMKKNPALADENVRKAIMYCIDKAALADAYGNGYEISGKSSLVAENSPYYAEVETWSQNLDTAKAAIDEAISENGWTSDDLTFTTWSVSGSDTSQIELLQYYLSTIGITLNIESADFATVLFEHLFVGDTSISIAENDTWDITRMLNMLDSRIDTSYDAYIGDYEDELHDLIDAAWAASEDDRYEAYKAVQQFAADHYMTTALNSCLYTDAWSNTITGMKYDAHSWPNVWAMRPVK